MFSADIKPDSVYCVGCTRAEGQHFHHCSECEIRAWAQEKKVESCGRCPEYACERIAGFFKLVPAAKAVLDGEEQRAD